MEDLSGKVAVITGAAGGLGISTTRLFASAGARVILTDIEEDRGRELAKEIGASALFLRQDVAKADDWVDVVKAAENAFGPVSILVNNAGMAQTPIATDLCTEEDYRRIFEANQLSVFLGMRAAAASLRKAGGGAIVNVSSVAGLVGHKGAIAYVASKFAVTGMTKVAALDFGADNIRVNSVHPGMVDTPMIRSPTDPSAGDSLAQICSGLPIPRPGRPEEIARVILFLASDAASFCTGAAFCADGGWTL